MATTYTVQPSDTLFLIARRFGTTVERIAQANNIADPNVINVGQVLIIPEGGETVGPGGTTAGNQQTRRVNGLLYSIFTDRPVYGQGEDVVITLVKTNVSGSDIILHYPNEQRYDFVTRRGTEQREIWRWSRGRSFAQVAADVTLRTGKSQVFQVIWDQRNNRGEQVRPGTITIEGFNVAQGFAGAGISTTIEIRTAVTPTPPTVTPTPTTTVIPSPTTTPCPDVNLLDNPGFEDWPDPASPPPSWTGSNLFRTTLSHSGNFAAELGATHNESAKLIQAVEIEQGRIYDLNWWARENIQPGNVARYILFVEIYYYRRNNTFVGKTEPRFSQEDIPDNIYQQYTLSTGRVPAEARIAEVRFTFEPMAANTNTVKIDDVELRCRF